MMVVESSDIPPYVEVRVDGRVVYVVQHPTAAELVAIYCLRYNEYVLRMRSLPAHDYPDGQEIDAYDDTAVPFVGLHRGVVRGAFRVVFPHDGKFLFEQGESGFIADPQLHEAARRGELCELSRIIGMRFEDSDAREIVQWRFLYAAVLRWSMRVGYRRWVFAIIEPFYRKMLEEGWPLLNLEYRDDYHGQPAYLVMVNLPELSRFLGTLFANRLAG